uniref:Uncharacterized protein n=1 Tax=Pristionchus pacificus TaxID=54126 RepID=A0A2A6BEQ3_PRIPA|eukprot:PDM64348.1 hypothetical protein PRIPAC_52604 [Pristionchus pacificus]
MEELMDEMKNSIRCAISKTTIGKGQTERWCVPTRTGGYGIEGFTGLTSRLNKEERKKKRKKKIG